MQYFCDIVKYGLHKANYPETRSLVLFFLGQNLYIAGTISNLQTSQEVKSVHLFFTGSMTWEVERIAYRYSWAFHF